MKSFSLGSCRSPWPRDPFVKTTRIRIRCKYIRRYRRRRRRVYRTDCVVTDFIVRDADVNSAYPSRTSAANVRCQKSANDWRIYSKFSKLPNDNILFCIFGVSSAHFLNF